MHLVHDRGRVHLDTEFLHYVRQIAIGDPILAVPAKTHQNDLDRETRSHEHR